ncbi:hypothetical protein P4T04_05090 [Bacillus badius]|uniref:hypothetical protein n=1 Tax=Bacillus badius TaxID=1455 RepID=UPI002E219E7E|nr:hypothetical protein [Bacillus badius]
MRTFISGAFWVSLIACIAGIVIFGSMSGIAMATGDKYWEEAFFKLGVDLGTFFAFLTIISGIVWLVSKLMLRKA